MGYSAISGAMSDSRYTEHTCRVRSRCRRVRSRTWLNAGCHEPSCQLQPCKAAWSQGHPHLASTLPHPRTLTPPRLPASAPSLSPPTHLVLGREALHLLVVDGAHECGLAHAVVAAQAVAAAALQAQARVVQQDLATLGDMGGAGGRAGAWSARRAGEETRRASQRRVVALVDFRICFRPVKVRGSGSKPSMPHRHCCTSSACPVMHIGFFEPAVLLLYPT